MEQAEANAAANEDQPGDNQCGAHSRHLADVGGFWDLRKSNRAAKRRLPLCRAPRRLITPAAQQLTGFLPGLFIAFVAVLGLEWGLRRYWGMV